MSGCVVTERLLLLCCVHVLSPEEDNAKESGE